MSKNNSSSHSSSSSNRTAALWILAGALSVGMIFARAMYAEKLWLTLVVGLALIATMAALIVQLRERLRSRSAAFGLNSLVTVLLVLGIVGVLNFLGARYPGKLDLTRGQRNSLSDQTIKALKALKQPVQATLYGKVQQREQHRMLLDNFKGLNPKFTLDFVDIDREIARAKAAGIKKLGTLHLQVGARESRIEDLTEEKLTNELIKLSKDKSPVVCALTGHGERSFASGEAEGYESLKKALNNQSYEVKDLNLVQENKVPESCDALAIMGPNKPLLGPEISLISDYLDRGGRAVVLLDLDLKGGEYTPELVKILEGWNVRAPARLIVDPLSRSFGMDAAAPVLASFSPAHPVTRDFRADIRFLTPFPFARPLEVLPGAPESLKIESLAQTTPQSWAIADLASIRAQKAIQFSAGKDSKGPLNVALAVSGKKKDSKAPRDTRLVVFGSTAFAINNHSRYGLNLDFFVNATSWVLEDESVISIRAKDEDAGRIDLSEKAAVAIKLLTALVLPLLVAAAGVGVWAWRRRL